MITLKLQTPNKPMSPTSYLQSILSYLTSMDIAKLRLYLKDYYTYQETTKEIFLNEVEEIFEAHRNSGDSGLLIFEGACAGKKCENCGKKGYRFVGNHSGNYMDLLFETEGEDIKDIFDCVQFKAGQDIQGLKTKADIYIPLDEQVIFNKTPEYWSKVQDAIAAYSEIITMPPSKLNFEELNNWLDKHSGLNVLIGNYDVFQPNMKWSPFSRRYDSLNKIRRYMFKQINEFIEANYLINQIQTEVDLINWLLKYDKIYENAPIDLKYDFELVDDNFRYNERNPIIFSGDEFLETISFFDYYHTKYYEILSKYSIYSQEEESENFSNKTFDNERLDIYSLRFHLERRLSLEKIGIHIPLYINQAN